MDCSQRDQEGVRNHSLGLGQSFGEGQAEEANRCSRCWGGRGLMLRGVKSVRLGEGWRLEAGCVMMMDVIYYRLDHPSPPRPTSTVPYLSSQSQSSLVPPPVCPSVSAGLSFMPCVSCCVAALLGYDCTCGTDTYYSP